MWLLITVLMLGDVVLAAWVLRERKAHRMSRNALRHWRRIGLTHFLRSELGASLHDVRGQNGVRDVRVSRVRGKGGEAA